MSFVPSYVPNTLTAAQARWLDDVVVPAIVQRGWKVFRGELDLNLVVWRTPRRDGDDFDDWLCVFHGDTGAWRGAILRCTADPGIAALRERKNSDGVAIIAEQQARRAWVIGHHKQGQPDAYPALRQAIDDLMVKRDGDRDALRDPGPKLFRGRGINLHAAASNPFLRPEPWHPGRGVGLWSEGCVVIADAFEYTMIFWPLILASYAKFGPYFTATVIDGADPTW